ncbi:MAG TPA: helix-turn-helix domain-containing protein [Polyangiaceae bacterium]|jgi:chromosomal replication initiation ATPase DnaA|nr:helix-turn-helix domain-containing protein [Polyangiaceae bacterium]
MLPGKIVRQNLEQTGLLNLATRVAADHHVALADLLGPCRLRGVVAARGHFWALLRDTLVMSYPEIGALFGADHTTVIYAVKRRQAEINGERGPGVVVCAENKFRCGSQSVA